MYHMTIIHYSNSIKSMILKKKSNPVINMYTTRFTYELYINNVRYYCTLYILLSIKTKDKQ